VCAARRPSVGVDFGTSTTLVATARGPLTIGDDGAFPWMPSLVCYDGSGELLVGERTYDVDDDLVIRSIKRWITDRRDFIRVDRPTGARDMRVDDLIAELLREAFRRGARQSREVGANSLVRLGCPAMWDGRQRRRLLAAAQRADLPVVLATMVDEPVAAGIAWLAHQPPVDRPLRMVVFDMGGGTLDIAVLDVRGGAHPDVTVLAAMGVPEAGDALDEAIAADLDLELAKAGIDVDGLPGPGRARVRLLLEARRAKVRLSVEDEVPISLSAQVFGRAGEVWYTRGQLNDVFQPQLERAEEAVALALRIARIIAGAESAYDIARMPADDLVGGVDVVLLSGGMSRIPYVRQRMQWFFDESTRVEPAMDPPENAVVVGLARAAEYRKTNMYRPAFDVVLEWERGHHFRTVYEAFTPLVGREQVERGEGELCFSRSGHDLALPRSGKGRLFVVSHSGDRLRASLGSRNLDGYPVSLSEEKFDFAIYPDGRIRLTDASGVVEGRVEDWHHLNAD
jgi:molecular chaperone DnaK